MKDIRIEVRDDNYIVVTATTRRFGKNAVMFEGSTFNECFRYVKRETGQERLQLSSYLFLGSYTDREGNTFPTEMSVI